MQFRDSFYQFVPPWLSTGDAEKYFYTLELMRDLLMEKSNQAQKIRIPGQGDLSQVPFLAHDRQLVQGPLEPDASFVMRLQGAIPTWNEAGSARAVLGQLQAYAQGHQSVDLPQFAIVSSPRHTDAGYVNTWWTLDYDDTEPLLSTVPANFQWDIGPTAGATWRAWLVLYQYLDAPTLSGASAATSTAGGGSFIVDDWGEEVAGVWVPKSSGTAYNTPFLTLTGLSGLLPEHVGQIITITGSGSAGNNGTFQIVQVLSASSCVVVNPAGVAADPGPLTWEIAAYPWMPPGLAWGSPGTVWGDGEGTPPPIDTGGNVRGTWQPTALVTAGERPTYAWGVRVDPLEIETIRGLVRAWKSAGTYYPNIIISYGAGEYDRTSAGTGNPDGSFAEVGSDVGAGIWAPTRALVSPWDCYCQGTGRAVACSLENMT